MKNFLKVFGHSSLMDINDKFGDVEEFCIACTKLLVNEISKRVHDDMVLVKFFEIKTSEELSSRLVPHVGINLYDDSNTIEITYRVEGDPEFRCYFVTLRDWDIAEVCMAE